MSLYLASERGSTDLLDGKSWEEGFAAQTSDAEKIAYLSGWQSTRRHQRICELTGPYDDDLPDWAARQIEQDGFAGLLPREDLAVAPKQPLSSVKANDRVFIDGLADVPQQWASVLAVAASADGELIEIAYRGAVNSGQLPLVTPILVIPSSDTE